MSRIELNINLNRVEGDLEIALTLENGVVAEVRSALYIAVSNRSWWAERHAMPW